MYNRLKIKTYSRKNSSYLRKAFVASNFNEMCRLCLSELDKGLTPIIRNSDKMSYQEWIEYSVDVKVQEGDGLPPNICAECLKLVEQTYLFKRKCRTSDSKLREHLELTEQTEWYRLRHSGVYFSDLEDEQNLFRRNKSTQSSTEGNNLSDSGGTAEDTHTIENPGEVEVIETVDNEDDDSAGEDECTYKDVTNTPKEKTQSDVFDIIDGKKTKESEQQTVNIPKQYKNRKKGEANDKGCQVDASKDRSLISKGDKRTDYNDDESEQLLEIIPDEKNDDTIIIRENSEKVGPREGDNSRPTNHVQESEKALKMICEQWECDDTPQAAEIPSTSGSPCNYTCYSSNDSPVTADRVAFDCKHVGETVTTPEQRSTTQRRVRTGSLVRKITRQQPRQHSGGSGTFQINRIYRTRSEIKIVETVPSAARYSCCTCSEAYPTLPELREHLLSVHQIAESSSCEICFKTFTCVNSLRRHMLIHTGFRPYKCRICDRRFSQTSTLKRHVLIHEASKPFVCHECKKSYTQKMSLVTHMKTHGTEKSSCVFNCQSCKKTFAHQSGLSRHLKEHKGFRFMCDDCMRSFVDPSALTRHVRRLHRNSNPRPTMNVGPRTGT